MTSSTQPVADTALSVIDKNAATLTVARPPSEVLAEAQKCAAELQGIISKKNKPVMIGNEQYLEFEDWQTVGRFYGVTAKVTDVRFTTEYGGQGFEARAVAVDVHTGRELSAAESMCLDSEERWHGRELFQIKSMAQTRACAKALRNVLSWVVVLAGYATTPAEELTGDEAGRGQQRRSQRPSQAPDARETQSTERVDLPGGVTTILSVKKYAGKNSRGDYTKYQVFFSNGKKAGTFSDTVGQRAEDLAGTGIHVLPDLRQDGQYLNLEGFIEPGATVPSPQAAQVQDTPKPEKEQPVREKVLTTRPLGATGLTVVQGSEREYVVHDAGVLDDVNLVRAAGGSAIFDYEWKRRTSDGVWVRMLTAVTDAHGAAKEGEVADQPVTQDEIKW